MLDDIPASPGFLVLFALYLQQFGTMVFAIFWHGYFAFCVVFATFGHGLCNVLAIQPLICIVFATARCFKRSCGFLESFFRLSFSVSFRCSFRIHLGFHLEFH